MSIITITKENFNEEVLNSNVPVLVDFWAPWCGYCRRLSPAIDAIEKKYEGVIKVAKVDIDQNPELEEKFSINTIPTLLLFKSGKEGNAIIAPDSKAKIEQWLAEQGVTV